MKQITLKQVETLACGAGRLASETRYAQGDWIRENSHRIADIETKRADKTYYGEWPKGWKAEMLRSSVETAKNSLVQRFLQNECKLLDGAIWLGNWSMIEELEKK